MKFAVLSEDSQFVDNVIVAREDQQAELSAALQRTLVDAGPLGLAVGDFFNGVNWTRNIDGEQVKLPLVENPDVEEILNIIEGGTN